jgi:hypothetical protein
MRNVICNVFFGVLAGGSLSAWVILLGKHGLTGSLLLPLLLNHLLLPLLKQVGFLSLTGMLYPGLLHLGLGLCQFANAIVLHIALEPLILIPSLH